MAIFLSAGNSSRMTSNSVFSSTGSAAATAPGAATAKPPTGAAALTPKASSICLTNSAASNRLMVF
jgi:hypothetical protein